MLDHARLPTRRSHLGLQRGHSDAIQNLDAILAVPGLTSVLIGPIDLAGSMGLMGQPEHPDVLRTLETIVAKTRQTGVWASVAIGSGPDKFAAWVRRGVQWITVGGDLSFMLAAAQQVASQVREQLQAALA